MLSIDGITSFSYKPLKLAIYFGIFTSLSGFLYLFIVLGQRLFTTTTIPGWSSLIILQLIFGGLILLLLGIVGEYIGRIYEEVKDRPLYIVESSSGFEQKEANIIRLHSETHS